MTLPDGADGELMRVLTDFALRVGTPYEVTDALHDLVDDVICVLGVSGAGVSLGDGDTVSFATAVPAEIAAVERAQEEAQSGPCIEAHRTGTSVLVPDLADCPHRWPALTEAPASVGVVAVAGIPVRIEDNRLGALDLYDRRRRDWDREVVEAATVLAGLAASYIANASRVDRLRHTAEQLQEALNGRVLIEQAKGILAGERGITVDQAFEQLRAHARRNGASLRSIADAVVTLGLRP